MTLKSTLFGVASVVVLAAPPLSAGGGRLDDWGNAAFGGHNRGGTADLDPRVADAVLGLDLPSQRLTQQGVRVEGSDAGVSDDLVRAMTPAAFWRWQAARGAPPAGYLDGTQADVLQAAGAPRSSGTGGAAPIAPSVATPSAVSVLAPVTCEEWNTEAYFEAVTVEDVTACLAAGADVAARTDAGHTPLHHAASVNEDPAVIEALVAAGADLETRNTNDVGATALGYAAFGNANPAVLEALLAAGADPTVRTDDGLTLLHLAARGNESPAVIEALVAAGVNLEERDDDGWTPLQRAASYNENPAVIEALVAAGADLETRNTNDVGATALGYAALSNANPAVLEALLAGGAEPTVRTDDGLTLLHLAARGNENPVVIEALLDAGADPGARTRNGNTPLHSAASDSSEPRVIESLLAAGADPFTSNSGGVTPWDLAQDNEALRQANVYWRMNDMRFNRPTLGRPAESIGSYQYLSPEAKILVDEFAGGPEEYNGLSVAQRTTFEAIMNALEKEKLLPIVEEVTAVWGEAYQSNGLLSAEGRDQFRISVTLAHDAVVQLLGYRDFDFNTNGHVKLSDTGVRLGGHDVDSARQSGGPPTLQISWVQDTLEIGEIDIDYHDTSIGDFRLGIGGHFSPSNSDVTSHNHHELHQRRYGKLENWWRPQQ